MDVQEANSKIDAVVDSNDTNAKLDTVMDSIDTELTNANILTNKIFQFSVNEYDSESRIWVGWKILTSFLITIILLIMLFRNKANGLKPSPIKIGLFILINVLLIMFTAYL